MVPLAFLGTRATGASKGSLPRPRARMVVEFGDRTELPTDPILTGRQRLAAASETVREALATHVRESEQRHQVFLPADDGVQGADTEA